MWATGHRVWRRYSKSTLRSQEETVPAITGHQPNSAHRHYSVRPGKCWPTWCFKNSSKLKTLNTQDLFLKGWEVGELRSRLDAHGEAPAAVRSTVLQAQILLWLHCYCHHTCLATGVRVSSLTAEQVRKGKQPEFRQGPLVNELGPALHVIGT